MPQLLSRRQVNEQWNKMDFILDWETNKTSLYINNKKMVKDEFYHGVDRYHIANEELPEYRGVDTLILYTLTPGTTS